VNPATVVLILTLAVVAPAVGGFVGWFHHRLNCPVHRRVRHD
jgi:hypothetical protein